MKKVVFSTPDVIRENNDSIHGEKDGYGMIFIVVTGFTFVSPLSA